MKHTRITALVLALAMTVALAAPAAAADAAGSPYAESIQRLEERGVIKGDGTGAYRPEDPLTRAPPPPCSTRPSIWSPCSPWRPSPRRAPRARRPPNP